jgi:dethiobiotin synthetase
MNHGYFVTGTDTGAGKTCFSLGLMQVLQSQGHVVMGMKPVASGCSATPAGLVNEDALQLQIKASFGVPYGLVNPYAFEPAVAPHLAAADTDTRIEISVIEKVCRELTAEADRVVVEGVGGWQVPINKTQTMADVAKALDLPVIMVVAVRLGCLNHALLTADAVERSGVEFSGWVANRIDPDCERQEQIIAALCERLRVPLLADVAYVDERPDAQLVADSIDVGKLFGPG